ncbi:MAG: hypothetical protein ABFS42_11200 [Candidatus Krumholzibacteriota bacterium]
MTNTVTTPKHLWIIGIVSLLWNMMGAYDYLMTQTKNAAYMAKFEPAQLDYFYNFPAWVVVFWALAVWGAVLGSVLLLMRKRLAAPVFLVSFASMVITAIYNFGLSNGMEVMGSTGFVFTVVIFFTALGLWLYARAMQVRGVLS